MHLFRFIEKKIPQAAEGRSFPVRISIKWDLYMKRYFLNELYIYIGSIFSKVPRRGPYLYGWFTNVYELTVSFRLSPISPEDAQGRLMGYTVTYVGMLNYNNSSNNSRTMVVGPKTTRITLRNVKEGSTYTIVIAGFTRKGHGTYSIFVATCKCKCYL